MRIITSVVAAAFVAFALGFSGSAFAAKPEIYTARIGNLAVGGYDPVAYFTVGAPTKGLAAHEYNFRGATWRFASAENLAAFRANPDAYAPQYGGYCAWAAAGGYTAPGNPQNWAVHGGKLYLNYNAKVQRDWNADRDGFIAKANANWPQILNN